MGCLDCSALQLSGDKIQCQYGLIVELGNLLKPEDCKQGNRIDNYFGKTYSMKTMIRVALLEKAKRLSIEELAHIQEETNITNQILLVLHMYEKKIDELKIEKQEEKEKEQGLSCYHCMYASSSDDFLFIECSYYQNHIGDKLKSCEQINEEWKRPEKMIKTIGLSHFFDLLLSYNSSLWLFLNEDMTAGDKWVNILDMYEETLEKQKYWIKRLN